jgi:putative endonuclease
MSKNFWILYIIKTKSGKLYTGITLELNRRFKQHQSLSGAKFFRIDRPLEIVYTELFSDRSSAQKREAKIKKMTKNQKIDLISSKKI